MNLNIDGNKVDLSVKIAGKDTLREKVLAFIQNPEPFMIYNNRKEGVWVLPEQMVTYDLGSGSLTKHDILDQMQWVIACACLAFEKVRALDLQDKKKLLDIIKKKKEVQEPKIILLN